MMDQTVTQFYEKLPEQSYQANYRLDHGPRLQAMVDRYDLKRTLAGKRVVDVGGGLGFLGELLAPTTDYWVIDGAHVTEEQQVSPGQWFTADLDHDQFASYRDTALCGPFDAAFCLETIEHLGNPHHCLVQIKQLVREGGDVFISIPTESVTHNAPYCGLLWPVGNFQQFLGQMALPIVDAYEYRPAGRGWPAYQFRCVNRPWREKQLLFPKAEAKFADATPLACTNL